MKVTLRMSHLKRNVKKRENINPHDQAALGAQCRFPVRWHSRVGLVTLWEKRMWPKMVTAKSWNGGMVKVGKDL